MAAAGLRAEGRRVGSSIAALQIVKSRSGSRQLCFDLDLFLVEKVGTQRQSSSSRPNLQSSVP
jgi:hypothetical protein